MQELGFHHRITDIQSALGHSQLKKLEQFMERRRYLVQRYDQAFSDLVHVRPAQTTGRGLSGHHLYVIRVDSTGRLNRGQLMMRLRQHGIGSQVHYIPVPAQPYYRRLGHSPELYPEAVRYYNEALSIPLFFDLTDDQQDDVIRNISEAVS
jgi:dTDP-4-amino-4,6-dideoxygalactose transaminase